MFCSNCTPLAAVTAEGTLGWKGAMGAKAIFNSLLSMQRHRANVKFRQIWGYLPPLLPRLRRQCLAAFDNRLSVTSYYLKMFTFDL